MNLYTESTSGAGIRKALADWHGELEDIVIKLGEPEVLAILAEEADELGKAALKLRRVLDGRNPTPIPEEEARENLQEEMADVLLSMVAAGLDEESVERVIRHKIPRWASRIDEKGISGGEPLCSKTS